MSKRRRIVGGRPLTQRELSSVDALVQGLKDGGDIYQGSPLLLTRSAEVVHWLADCGLDVNATNWCGIRPAEEPRSWEVAKALFDRGATFGWVHDTAKKLPSSAKLLRLYVDHGFDPLMADKGFYFMCHSHNAAAIRYLLQLGATVEHSLNHRLQPETQKDFLCVRALLQGGAPMSEELYEGANARVKQLFEHAGYSPVGKPASLQRQCARLIRERRINMDALPFPLARGVIGIYL